MFKKWFLVIVILISGVSNAQEELYVIKNINVNNNYSNFGTTFFGENKIVYASPKKRSYIIRNVWKGNDQPFLDLFIGEIGEDGNLLNVRNFSDSINTRYHEADVAFTKDNETVYFSRNNYFNKKLTRDSKGTGLIQLYRAEISDEGEWIHEEPMPFNNDEYQTGHPTLSADEKTLYFISDMPGSIGKTDVYKASIDSLGNIGIPLNMGPQINTPEREMFCSISGNNELYFSSDGRKDGLGGLDIYVTKLSKNGLTEPVNLGNPLNSNMDDFAFILDYNTRRGYFSSNRTGGKGDDDIYTFVQEIPIVFECKQIVKGTVFEKTTGLKLPNSMVLLKNKEGKLIDSLLVGVDATFEFEVDCNDAYTLIGVKETFSSDTKDFFSTEGEEIEIPLFLDKNEFIVERGKCLIKINPIYFDFDKSNIREDAAIELKKVIDVMKKYPELIIEGGSHTDSRGSYKYNIALSARRAKSTVEYIISQGIDPANISARGYGETQLVNACSDGAFCSEEDHQLNRRTEFVVVNYDEIKKKYPGICAIEAHVNKVLIESDKHCKQTLNGVVSEKDSGVLLPGATVILYDEDENILRSLKTDSQAEYSIEVECNTTYILEARKENYNLDIKEFESGSNGTTIIDLKLKLEEFIIKNGNCIVKINPIYFDFDKSYIREDAAIELKKVIDVMKKYPELIIEGGSHTDSRGSYDYNIALSSRRAKSTVQYIISKGIDPEIISARGYGEIQLVNSCSDGVFCSEEDHQLNRRTEFVVVNSDEIKEKYPEICAIHTTSTQEQITNDVKIVVDDSFKTKSDRSDIEEQKNKENKFGKRGEQVMVKIDAAYFEVNSSYLTAYAAKELNKVVEIMLNYPDLIIECGSHTDSRASDNYNQLLSERRAKRSVDYIIERGISPERIKGIGYGEKQLLNKCSNGVKCSEKEHELNRRTEFIIVNPKILEIK